MNDKYGRHRSVRSVLCYCISVAMLGCTNLRAGYFVRLFMTAARQAVALCSVRPDLQLSTVRPVYQLLPRLSILVYSRKKKTSKTGCLFGLISIIKFFFRWLSILGSQFHHFSVENISQKWKSVIFSTHSSAATLFSRTHLEEVWLFFSLYLFHLSNFLLTSFHLFIVSISFLSFIPLT